MKKQVRKICATCYYLNVEGRAGYIVCSKCFQHDKWKKAVNTRV